MWRAVSAADMAVVYHWKHGWIRLDHEAAPHATGIQSRQDVAKAVRGLPNVPSGEHGSAMIQLRQAAEHHNSTDLLPGHKTVAGVDQYGRPTSFTGHIAGQSVANKGNQHGVVYSVHNGSDKSGLDASARGTVFVPDVPGQARSMSPADLHRENQGDFQAGQEVALRGSTGLRVGVIESVGPDGRLVVKVPGEGKVTRTAQDLRHEVPKATREAELRRLYGDFRKTPLATLERIIRNGNAGSPEREAAIRREIARRLAAVKQ
jgi:hypothetical protein